MYLKAGSLNKYPYISYNDYNTEAFKLDCINSTALIWNTKCSLRCEINNQEKVIPSGSIIILDRGNSFRCGSNGLSQIKVLRFNAKIFSNSLIFIIGFINRTNKRDFKNYTMLFFKNEESLLIENIFKRFKEHLEEYSSIDIEKLISTISSLLKNALAEKFVQDAKCVNRFGEMINSQFNLYHNVSDYALQLNMEPKNLLRMFQRQGLKNPSYIIKEKLLLEIKKSLIYSNKSMREICFEMGFYDPAYFSRFFKKHIDITALCFRNQYVKKLDSVELENSTI